MNDLKNALKVRAKYLAMSLDDVVAEFERFTGQTVPREAVESFEMRGLNNIDFLTGYWEHFGELKNLVDFEKEVPQSYADMSYAERLWQERQDEGGSVVMGRLEFVRYVEEAMKAQREACTRAFIESLRVFTWDVKCSSSSSPCKFNVDLGNQHKAIVNAEVQP